MSLDSQFLALSSMFTHDIIARALGEKHFSDRQRIFAGRLMVVAIVATAYAKLSCKAPPTIYQLGVWCFSGFAGLFPLVFAVLYWRRVTTTGAIASIAATLAVWGRPVPRIALGRNTTTFSLLLTCPRTTPCCPPPRSSRPRRCRRIVRHAAAVKEVVQRFFTDDDYLANRAGERPTAAIPS